MRYLKRGIILYIGEDSWGYPLLLHNSVSRDAAGGRFDWLAHLGTAVMGLAGYLYFADYMVSVYFLCHSGFGLKYVVDL